MDPGAPLTPPSGAPTNPGGYAPPPDYGSGAGAPPPYTPPPGYAQPPPGAPPPGAPPPHTPPGPPAGRPAPQPLGGARGFIIGAAIGLIPLLLAMIGLGSLISYSPNTAYLGNFLIAGAIGLPIGLIVSIILSIVTRTRQIGLGMLTAVVVSPVIFFVGCLVILSRPFGL